MPAPPRLPFRCLIFGLSLLSLILSTSLHCQADNPQPPASCLIRLYVNGVLQSATKLPAAWRAAGHSVVGRGFFAGKPVDFTNGIIADARAYSRALTPAEVQSLYTEGPSTHWKFDQAEDGASEANNSNQWQLMGGAKWLPSQKEGGLSVNGTAAYADLGQSILDTSQSYTVSAWVMFNSLDGHQTFVSQDGANLSGFYLQKRIEDNKFAFAIRAADNVDAPTAVTTSTFAPQINVIYHVVGVYERSAIVPLVPQLPWDSVHQGQFTQSLTHDLQGNIWVATEGQGVWRFNPHAASSRQWMQFTSKDGLGSDKVYALSCDARGRLWAGTLHGLSIYNGKQWKTYGPQEGIGGFRIFALASCPTNGDIWIATEGGLTRYLSKQDRWRQYSRLDGLPSDAVQCLAFNKSGGLYVGTQADGIAIASAKDDYKVWRVVRGPARPPELSDGSGLPTSLINCMLAANSGTIYAGTDDGLARSEDGGGHWHFLRGTDWADKRNGTHPAGWLDSSLVDHADVRAIEVLPLDDSAAQPIRIAAGGPGADGWSADSGFNGGGTYHEPEPVNARAIPHPAPQSVYQSGRWGSFTYSIPRLRPGAEYQIRLHFAEAAFDKPGERVFNVSINGERVLDHFDIRAESGAKNLAIVRAFTARANMRGRIELAFRGSQPLPASTDHNPYEMTEDYVTALAEDGAGHLLIGHRQKGMETISLASGQRVFPSPKDEPPTDFVTGFLPQYDGTVLISTYGGGVIQKTLPGFAVTATFSPNVDAASVPLPMPATPPTLAELNAMLRVVSAVPPDKTELTPHVVALQDDWLTEGDWLGRYGRYWACVPACSSPLDYYWGAGWQAVDYTASIGPNGTPDDYLRYWVQTLYTTEPHCLEMPPTYLDSRVQKKLTTRDKNRRDCSQDDHGETYPMALDGPNIYQNLSVPPGLYVMSLYFFNRQGGGTSDRDYRLSVRPHADVTNTEYLASFSTLPEWAHGRVLQYYPGVWKRFLVRGPQTLTVEVNRNHSWNTELDGVMLDLVDETPPPYFGTVTGWEQAQEEREIQRQQAVTQGFSTAYRPATTEEEAANRLLATLDVVQATNSSWWANYSRQFYAPLLRWYVTAVKRSANSTDTNFNKHFATCQYQMGQYSEWEEVQRYAGMKPARDVEKSLSWNGNSDMGEDYQVVVEYLNKSQQNSSSRSTTAQSASHKRP